MAYYPRKGEPISPLAKGRSFAGTMPLSVYALE